MTTTTTYAPYVWLITEDHITRPEDGGYAEGIHGPGTPEADPELLARLRAGEGDGFELFDDDGELYYRGRLITRDPEYAEEEDACYAPLRDFGAGWAGCTLVHWPQHPERDCG